jgi:hypothetical protein
VAAALQETPSRSSSCSSPPTFASNSRPFHSSSSTAVRQEIAQSAPQRLSHRNSQAAGSSTCRPVLLLPHTDGGSDNQTVAAEERPPDGGGGAEQGDVAEGRAMCECDKEGSSGAADGYVKCDVLMCRRASGPTRGTSDQVMGGLGPRLST